MQFRELQLNHFGKFHNKTIILKEGINLIYGENEAGKSTIHSFIQGMLFGIEKTRGRASREDSYVKYQPFDTPGLYSGSMDFLVGEKNIRIIRNLDKNNKSSTILDLETGRELNLNAQELIELYGGLTKAGYRNTISIEQLKAKTDQELAEEVRNYIANLSLTKSSEVDVTKALRFLQGKKKELEAQQLDYKILEVKEEIAKELELEIKKDELTLKLKEIEEQEKLLMQKIQVEESKFRLEKFSDTKGYQAYLNQFPVIFEKYKSYQDTKKQAAMVEAKIIPIGELSPKMTQESCRAMGTAVEELASLKLTITVLEGQREKFLKEASEKIQVQKQKRFVLCFLPVLLGLAGMGLNLMKNSLITILCTILIVFGVAAFFALNKRIKAKFKADLIQSQSYDKKIGDSVEKEKKILRQYQAEDVSALKIKYDEALRIEKEIDHKNIQKEEYISQKIILDEKIIPLEQEIVEYIKPFHRILKRTDKTCNLEDDVMIEIEEFVQQEKQTIVKSKELVHKEYENLRMKKEKLKWEFTSLEGNEEKLLQNQELHKELLQKNKDNETELKAIKLAIETINNLSIDIHDSFGQELNNLVSEFAGGVTNGKYVDVKIDEKLNIKVAHKNNYVLLDRLSAGTIEQLYLSLRLAISELVYGKDVMPLLLDDCFALYDDTRTAAALNFLSKKRGGQVLLFTCQLREKVMLDDRNINYHYINLN